MAGIIRPRHPSAPQIIIWNDNAILADTPVHPALTHTRTQIHILQQEIVKG